MTFSLAIFYRRRYNIDVQVNRIKGRFVSDAANDHNTIIEGIAPLMYLGHPSPTVCLDSGRVHKGRFDYARKELAI